MVAVKKYVARALLAGAFFFMGTEQANSGGQILGIGGFSDDAFNAAIVATLSAIESLNEIANSNTAKTLGHTKELAEQLAKTVKRIDRMATTYKKMKMVAEMGMMSVTIFKDFLELVKHIYNNEELLAIEEVEMLCHLLDYAVFDAVAANQASGGKGFDVEDVGGGVLKQLTDMVDWIFEEKDESVTYSELDRRVTETHIALTRIYHELRLIRRYTYGYMVAKRYRRGAYDNWEYVQHVYYSKYREMIIK
ncbi:MAG: hypothetical protein LBJ57_07660 [Prevotellaceae bacterium]|jgi:DNA-binding protein YbaB|nr:hypothetical protein [Prevotellaceae bacterium]